MSDTKFEANGGFTLRVASPQRPPSALLTAAAVPIHEGQPGKPEMADQELPPRRVNPRLLVVRAIRELYWLACCRFRGQAVSGWVHDGAQGARELS